MRTMLQSLENRQAQSVQAVSETKLEGVVCPSCLVPLAAQSQSLQCLQCLKTYPVKNGIPCFVEIDPNALPFKEEYFEFWFEKEDTHFWHIGRKESIFRFIEPYIKE